MDYLMIQSLPGFRAFYPEETCLRAYVFDKWRACARSFNFLEYDAPVLEPLELFTQKSGTEIVKQLFHFQDQGGRAVALRPEMTPSLARLVGTRGAALKKPIKWFSLAECFRYERPQKGRLRSFYQLNVDLLGEASHHADAECMALLIQSFKSFGLKPGDFALRLSDRALWSLFLESFGLNPIQCEAILPLLDKLDGPLASTKASFAPYLQDRLEGFIQKTAQVLNIKSLPELETFIEQAWPDVSLKDKAKARLKDWKALLDRLEGLGVGAFIRIDLSIVRGLAYYTGFVFEAFEATGQGRALAGGGRYDELLGKLSGSDLPAVGFGLGDVTLLDILKEKDLLPPDLYQHYKTPDVFIVYDPQAPDASQAAFAEVGTLRSLGYQVDYALKDLPLAKQERLAYESKARMTVSFYPYEGRMYIKLKDLSTKEEQTWPLEDKLEALKSLQSYLIQSY